MRLGSEVPTRVGISLSVRALGVSTYGHVYHSGARKLRKHLLVYHSGASTFSHVLVQARVGGECRENKTRHSEVVLYLLHTKRTQLAEQIVCSREDWLITPITPPFILVRTKASYNLLL